MIKISISWRNDIYVQSQIDSSPDYLKDFIIQKFNSEIPDDCEELFVMMEGYMRPDYVTISDIDILELVGRLTQLKSLILAGYDYSYIKNYEGLNTLPNLKKLNLLHTDSFGGKKDFEFLGALINLECLDINIKDEKIPLSVTTMVNLKELNLKEKLIEKMNLRVYLRI